MGLDGVFVGNSNILYVSHIGSTRLNTNKTDFALHNVMHAYGLSTSLIYVQKFCLDNNIFIEFYAHCFCVKDNNTMKILYQGIIHRGLF